MSKKNRATVLVLAVLAAFLVVPSKARAGCTSYTSPVYYHGVGSRVYVNTPVWACISDSAGTCKAGGGYLHVKNHSSSKTITWSSVAAGAASDRTLDPGQQVEYPLTVYTRDGESPRVNITVTVCD